MACADGTSSFSPLSRAHSVNGRDLCYRTSTFPFTARRGAADKYFKDQVPNERGGVRTLGNVFIALTGEYQNVGDGLIRRVALDWVRADQGVSAFFGDAPQSWIEQMELTGADRVVTGGWGAFVRWLLSAVVSWHRPVLVTEPGEMTLARWNIPRQVLVMIAAICIRIRGGSVILPPRAVTRRAEALPWLPTVLVHRAICRLATVCLWRDQWSLDTAGAGNLVPDTGFAADLRLGADYADRRKLVLSMRGARAFPPQVWFDGITQFAASRGFEIVTLAQVEADDVRARELAQRLGGRHFPWTGDGLRRERELRHVYDNTALVVSDRLHVLIIAALSGVVPTEIADTPTAKVKSHFATIGLNEVSLDCRGSSADEIADWLESQSTRHLEVRDRVIAARSVLLAHTSRMRELVLG